MSIDILKMTEAASMRNLRDPSALSDYFEAVRLLWDVDRAEAKRHNANIKNKAAVYARDMNSRSMLEMYRRSLLFAAKYDFDSFMLYMEWKRNPDKRFYQPRRNVLRPVVQAFQDVNDGKIDLLTVSQPKRTGKSTLGEWFGLFRSGQSPLGSSIFCGAGNDLVKSFYTGILDVLTKPDEYTFYEIFPQATLEATNADEKTIHLLTRKRFATVTCRSIDGALTGSTEATPDGMLYLDDLVSDDVEANNRNRLDTLWDKVRGDLLGRRLEGCPIVAQGTRYSLYDPIGRLQDIAPTMGWRTKILAIPALDPKTDESNFSIVLNGKPMFTTDYYRKERELVSPVQWASQFQQEPYEARGLLFPAERLNRYMSLPADIDPDGIIAACDTAEGGGDSVMLPIAYLYGDDVYIVDCVFSNDVPEVTKKECAEVLMKHKVANVTFESNSAGAYYARDVEKIIRERGGKTGIKTKRSISNKKTRIEVASDNILKNFYFLDPSLYTPNSEYGQMMKELTTYVRSGKVAHDDAPDGLSMLENEIRNMCNTVEVKRRYF